MKHLNKHIHEIDTQIEELIEKEKLRQEEHIELIASENYVSNQVLHGLLIALI